MAESWREKLQRWFAEEKVYEKQRPGRRLGRIEERDHNVLPRVRHQYPRKGGLPLQTGVDQKEEVHTRMKSVQRRRPVIREGRQQQKFNDRPGRNEERKKPALHHNETSHRTFREHKDDRYSEPQQAREKFTGVDFRASDVPSPVYGFRKRRNLFSKDPGDEHRQMDIFPTENPLEEANAESDESQDMIKVNEDMDGAKTNAQSSEIIAETEETNSKTADLTEKPSEVVAETETEEIKAQTADLNEKASDKNVQIDEIHSPISETDSHTTEPEQEIQVPTQTHPYTEQGSQQQDTVEQEKETQLSSKPAMKSVSQLPSQQLLSPSPPPSDEDEGWMNDQRERLSETLEHFNVKAEVVGVTKGPAVTRFEVQPAPGVKVNKITKLSDDLKLSLAARDIRIEAPIPGKSTVGIEIPNPTSTPVSLREMIESKAFQDSKSPLTAALGLDIAGTPIITDLQKMPHGLISGATGSGKSVCINSLLISLLYKATPDELKMVLIDPKVVELAPFKDIPHLAAPVINDPKEASRALKWAVEEMERRYECLAEAEARDIARYNRRMNEQGKPEETMPYIVIIIDELADLMMVSPQEVEDSICRIAQKARACGIHLVLATQRPSVDVITGLIKANIPTRIAFSVSSQADSRTILDKGGAEKLLGHGDMLFVENGAPQSVRVQGNFVSDEEIDRITDFARSQGDPDYLFEKEALQEEKADHDEADELFEDAGFFVFEQGTASTSSLQRHFRIGYNRAARLIDSMEASGMISEAKGSKPRQLLMSEEEFLEQILKVET